MWFPSEHCATLPKISAKSLSHTLSLPSEKPECFQTQEAETNRSEPTMLCLRPNTSFFLLLSLSVFLFVSSAFASSRVHHTLRSPGDFNGNYFVFCFLKPEFLFYNNLFCKGDSVFCMCVVLDVIEIFVEKEYGGVVHWNTKKSVAEKSARNSFLILAKTRTLRKDPLDGFNRYTRGWNISNEHYWAVRFFFPSKYLNIFSSHRFFFSN